MAEKKSGTTILRLILFVVLGVVLVIAYFELNSRQAAQAAFDKIDAAVTANESLDQAKIREWLGREPDSTTEVDPATKQYDESYVFAGPIKRRTITVTYTKRATALVEKVSIK